MILARFPHDGDATKAGYVRYTEPDDTGAISYANQQWTSDPTPDTVVKIGKVPSANYITTIFEFPTIWDLIVLVQGFKKWRLNTSLKQRDGAPA
jgi:hypothetical protein